MSRLALSKYAGSHGWLAEQQPDLFPLPDPGGRAFVPCVGAGSPVFELYAGRYPLILSDKNPRLVNAWVQVRDDVEPLIERLECLVKERLGFGADLAPEAFDAHGLEHFECVRSELDNGTVADRAATFLFVLRAAYNGLWRVNRDGECNSPYGKPEPDADLVRADDMRRMSKLLQGAEIRCEDFAATLRPARAGDATYIDPPFQGTHSAFCADGAEWEARQATLPGLGECNARERLAALLYDLNERGVRWSLSDSDHPVTRNIYGGWPRVLVARRNSVTCKGGDRGDAAMEGLWRNWQSPTEPA